MNATERIKIVCLRTPLHERIAERLIRDIRSYRVPRDVQKATGVRFLTEAADQWLIVICSPGSPADPDTLAAIERFTDAGKYSHILTLLAEGDPAESFPQSLLFERMPDGTVIEHEPLAANIVATNDGKRLRKLETEKLRLFATILGVPFDSLMNRRRKRRRRILLGGAAAVLAAAGTFLGYALDRMHVMAVQNEELSLVYADTEAERDKAQADRDAAREKMAQRVGVQASSSLKSGDSELTLLLCLEYLPEMDHIPELTEALADALHTLCAEGYVPVTTRKAYLQSGRSITGDLQNIPAPTEQSVWLTVPLPESLGRPGLTAQLKREDVSVAQNLAVYSAEGYSWNAAWVGPADAPEAGGYLTRPDGALYGVNDACFLEDGSLLLACADTLYRLDPITGEELPIQDGRPEPSLTLDFPVACFWQGEGLPRMAFDVGRFWQTDGFADRIFALGRDGFAVFSRDPFRLMYAVHDMHTEQADTAPTRGSYWTGLFPAALPNGERYIVVGSQYVYDGETGAFLYGIEDYGQNMGGRTMQLSAEGYVTIQIHDILCMWDLSARQSVGSIPGIYYRYAICGPYDEATGRCSASLVVADSTDLYSAYPTGTDGMIWALRERAIPVPSDLEGQIALAKELLNGREMTEAERLRFQLSDP